jgi:ribosomal protein S18 acetylase RimI-like enzyme
VPVAGRKPLPMQVDYDAAVRAHRFDLLEIGEDLVALIETTPDVDQLLIVNVAVRPAFQGRGLGVRLMRHAEALAAQAGLAGTRLYTNKLFEANVRLYRSLGYGVDGEEEVAPGVVRVNMSKPRA